MWRTSDPNSIDKSCSYLGDVPVPEVVYYCSATIGSETLHRSPIPTPTLQNYNDNKIVDVETSVIIWSCDSGLQELQYFRFSICKQPSPLKKINNVRKNINTVGIKMKHLWLDEAIYVDFRSSLNFVCEESVKFSIPDGIQNFIDVWGSCLSHWSVSVWQLIIARDRAAFSDNSTEVFLFVILTG